MIFGNQQCEGFGCEFIKCPRTDILPRFDN